MQCLIYVRVSTDKQASRDLSLPAQLQACRAYAAEQQWSVEEVFVEEGVSGRSTNRPALRQLLRRCRRKHSGIEVVLVHKVDRLARNLTDHAMIRALLKKRGIRLVSVQEHFEDSISGQLVENIMAVLADFYSANLSEEVLKGMRQKARTGGWPHRPPRGYQTVTDVTGRREIQIDPVEGPLVLKLFELYASGQWSLRPLAVEMARRGLRTASGHQLASGHLRALLSNPFYQGRIVWSDLDVAGQHPALISPTLFERVRLVLADRHRVRPQRRTMPGFPLRGFAQCGTCGGNMMAERHGRFGYYRCGRQQYRHDLCDARFCPADQVHADLRRICEEIVTRQPERRGLLRPLDDPKFLSALKATFRCIRICREGVSSSELKSRLDRCAEAA